MQTQAVPNLINLIIAVDMSGSMLTRWESVQRGVREAHPGHSEQPKQPPHSSSLPLSSYTRRTVTGFALLLPRRCQVFEAANILSAVDCITIIPFNESVVMLGPAPKAAFPFRDFFSITPR